MAEQVRNSRGEVVSSHTAADKTAADIAYANSEAGKRQARKPEANSAVGSFADLGAVARAAEAARKKKAAAESQADALDKAYKKQ